MNRKTVLGPLLILVGVYLFLNKSGSLGPGSIFAYFWPTLFVLPVGLLLHWLYFSLTGRKGVGMLVPGGILITAAVVCQISNIFGNWETTWPGFILAPAVGLLELYWFGGRNKWLLIPINILTVVALLFLTVFSVGSLLGQSIFGQPLLAIILLIAGAYLMLSKKREY
ncbi:hypothetical protein J2Z69_002559 [Paenibacillus shirakamiensis]|uniref:DUF5668 domain-containing protein n=1 Tax=Paenibacillus shirakamiensis TaxID=1265935 RepID=A0ABS4JIH7_9BACL|nr:hypothetical protein [Paenibacillus shirakamiensis]MBP2001514.1 hypothetical protein [Paenibacillus shirakamiensis]